MILVTGGAGNVGANVVRQLLDAGEKVRVITRDPRSRSSSDQVEVVPGDLTQPETLIPRSGAASRPAACRAAVLIGRHILPA